MASPAGSNTAEAGAGSQALGSISPASSAKASPNRKTHRPQGLPRLLQLLDAAFSPAAKRGHGAMAVNCSLQGATSPQPTDPDRHPAAATSRNVHSSSPQAVRSGCSRAKRKRRRCSRSIIRPSRARQARALSPRPFQGLEAQGQKLAAANSLRLVVMLPQQPNQLRCSGQADHAQ